MVFRAIKEAWDFVDRPLKKIFSALLIVRLVTNFFDLVGTALMALLVGYVVSVLSGNPQTLGIKPIIDFFGLQSLTIRNQVIFLGAFTLIMFILRPAIVLPISRVLSFGIQRKGALFTNDLMAKFTSLQISSVRSWSSPDVNYVASGGISIILQLLWTGVSLVSDLVLILMFLITLFITNTYITLGLLLYILLLFGILSWINGSKMQNAGRQSAITTSSSTKVVMELLSTFRELYVSNRMENQIERFKDIRLKQGESIAISEWLGQVPRYVIDSALVLGIVLVAVSQSSNNSISAAASSTALFLTAALRILPTIAPIQGSINGIKNMKGLTEKVQEFSRYVEMGSLKRQGYLRSLKRNNANLKNFSIVVENLTLSYKKDFKPALQNISFQINSGSTLAIIGSSGSGKTTLADCLLGLLEPTSGRVEIDKTSPEIYRSVNSGSISYVSQDVALIDGSIRENVAFALPQSEIDDAKIYQALKRAHIDDFIRNLPQGLETVVGERGTRLSGGQRQRIGIARALYSNPKILVLDEATSALDAETESAITGMLKELHGEVTIISIAHRLSTVMHSDLVLFLRDGKLAGSGKFEDLVKQHPDLAHQAELLGIDLDQN
jgi:ATP-binding cassette, subfamily B, bacterial PglK